MSNLKQRFILAGVAIPALAAAILLLPYVHYIAIAAAVAVFSGLGAQEIARMFARRDIPIHPAQAFLSGALLPAAAWVDEAGIFPLPVFLPALILAFSLIVGRQAFIFTPSRLKNTLEKTAAAFLLVLYPGLFMSYLVRACFFAYPGLSVLLFLALMFSNDSLAFGTGMLFGGGNRNIFAASPNKSIAGLLGGITGAAAVAYLWYAFIPEIFFGNTFFPLILAVLCACAADIGDLAESAMKRSAAVKDSGKILKGRGGVMDSIDSILFGAPVFYFTMQIITLLSTPR